VRATEVTDGFNPSCPSQFFPQHHRDPSCFTAQVCSAPAATDETLDDIIWIGVIAFERELLPI
jgi:hypothetical protein